MNLGHPPPKPTGKSSLEVSNAWMNDYVRTLRIIDSPDIKPSYTRDGCMLWYVGGGGGSSIVVARFKILSVTGSTLSCKRVINESGDLDTIETVVAIPPFLRRDYLTTRDDITYLYTSDYSTRQERLLEYADGARVAEEIRPRYAADDYIHAALTEFKDPDTQATFIDANIDGRTWHVKLSKTEVCDNGETKHSYIARSSLIDITP